MEQLAKVRFVREIIIHNEAINRPLTEEQITEICRWLGFADTAFRDKKAWDKLDDFLLQENYWLDRAKNERGEG